MMDDVEIRMECLRIATKFASAGKTNDVGLAEAYYRFVRRLDQTDCEPQVAHRRSEGD